MLRAHRIAARPIELVLAVLLVAAIEIPAQGAAKTERAAEVPSCDGLTATIVGTGGDDTLSGTAGDDVIAGLAGRDFIDAGAGDDVVCGGSSTRGGEEDQSLFGGDGRDTLLGGPDADDLYGGGGDDEMRGHRGSDYLSGDSDKQPGQDRLFGGRGGDWLDGYYAVDELYGGPGADSLFDDRGSNVEFGGRGDDLLWSGPFDEALDGGPGIDVVEYTGSCNDVSIDLLTGTGSGEGFGTDRLTTIEGAYTGGGRDVLVGDDNSNLFYPGSPCRDSWRDRVQGGGGNDTLSFATELILAESAAGPVRVDLAAGEAGTRRGGDAALVRFTSIENVDGTSSRDELLGSAGANVFNRGWVGTGFGLGGDVVYARGGADVLWGNHEGDRMYGGRGGDSLLGRRGPDRLWGQRGADLLEGGRGSDHNIGGKGRDICRDADPGPRAASCEAR